MKLLDHDGDLNNSRKHLNLLPVISLQFPFSEVVALTLSLSLLIANILKWMEATEIVRKRDDVFLRVNDDQTQMTRDNLQFSLQSRLRIYIEQINR